MKLEVISRYPGGARRPVPLLFVPGAFSGAWVWDEHFLPYFARHGFAAHAVSLRGHAGSDGQALLATLRNYADDVAAAVRWIGEPPVLIGHSLGGLVVQRYIRDHPARGVALLASGPPHGMLASGVAMAVHHPWLVQQLTMMQWFGRGAVVPSLIRRALFSDSLPWPEVLQYLARFGDESILVQLEIMALAFGHWDGAGRTPVLVMGAADDVFIPTWEVQATGRAYGVEPVMLPDLAHAMMLDTGWERAADALLGWLDDTVAPAAVPQAA